MRDTVLKLFIIGSLLNLLLGVGGCKQDSLATNEKPVENIPDDQVMDESEIEDFDKYYKPAEFEGMDMLQVMPNGHGSAPNKVSISSYSGKLVLVMTLMRKQFLPI